MALANKMSLFSSTEANYPPMARVKQTFTHTNIFILSMSETSDPLANQSEVPSHDIGQLNEIICIEFIKDCRVTCINNFFNRFLKLLFHMNYR